MTVTIRKVASQKRPPVTTIEYEVRNDSKKPLWLVDDGWLVWDQTDDDIELSYARVRMRPGSQVYGYFNPSVVKLKPDEQTVRVVRLEWPQPLDRLWNAEPEAKPQPGWRRIKVRVGYGEIPEPAPPQVGEGVEAPVLRWQREATSPSVDVEVPPYRQ